MTSPLSATLPAPSSPDATWRTLHEQACAPYRRSGRFAWHFARGKLGHDPVFRGLLQRGRDAADSVHAHLEAHGISVNILFELDQLRERTLRLEAVLDVLLSPAPAPALQRLLVDLVTLSQQRRSLRAVLGRQYSLLARKVAERHAETGEHYITRNRDEYRSMLRHAAGRLGALPRSAVPARLTAITPRLRALAILHCNIRSGRPACMVARRGARN